MIPKRLHQIWLGPRARPADMLTWLVAHPGWEYKVWTEADVPTLSMRHAKLFDAFHGLYHAQADIMRYEILRKYGGVYVDADTECMKPLGDEFLDAEAFAVRENDNDPPLITNCFMGAVPGAALLTEILDDLDLIDVSAIATEDRRVLYDLVWRITGPQLLSEVVHYGKKSPVVIHPKNFFSADGIYGRHWSGSTKHLYDQPRSER